MMGWVVMLSCCLGGVDGGMMRRGGLVRGRGTANCELRNANCPLRSWTSGRLVSIEGTGSGRYGLAEDVAELVAFLDQRAHLLLGQKL